MRWSSRSRCAAIGHDLKVGVQTLDWTSNAYALTYASGIVTARDADPAAGAL